MSNPTPVNIVCRDCRQTVQPTGHVCQSHQHLARTSAVAK